MAKKELFIRLDMKGHWRGKDHVSSSQGMGDDFPELFHKGISCYSLKDQAYALDKLRWYWFQVAMIKEKELENMQVTIFEGEKVGEGPDWEDLATCERTIKEFDAKDFMLRIQDAWEEKEWGGDLTEEEYQKFLNELDLGLGK